MYGKNAERFLYFFGSVSMDNLTCYDDRSTRDYIAVIAALIAVGCSEVAQIIVRLYLRGWLPKIAIINRRVRISTYQYRMHIGTLHDADGVVSGMAEHTLMNRLISTNNGVLTYAEFLSAVRSGFGNYVAGMFLDHYYRDSHGNQDRSDYVPEYPIFNVKYDNVGTVTINGFEFDKLQPDGTFSRRYVNDFPCMMIGGTFFCVIKPAGEEAFLSQLNLLNII